MLVDIHTNLFWYPDHLSEEFVETSWAAKRAKMRLTGDVHCDVDDTSWKHNFDCRPEQLLGAIYQNFDPADPKHLPLFKKAESLGIPINWHQGTSFVRTGPLKYANPVLLEDIAVACPELRMIISHMGHPWEAECVVLIRKHPQLFADTSALHYRPLRHYQAFITALEYGVEHKLIFGSDFPSATPEQVIAGLKKVNDVVKGTSFPKFPDEAIRRMIYENWRSFISFD